MYAWSCGDEPKLADGYCLAVSQKNVNKASKKQQYWAGTGDCTKLATPWNEQHKSKAQAVGNT